jgi:hypothetical protein
MSEFWNIDVTLHIDNTTDHPLETETRRSGSFMHGMFDGSMFDVLIRNVDRGGDDETGLSRGALGRIWICELDFWGCEWSLGML